MFQPLIIIMIVIINCPEFTFIHLIWNGKQNRFIIAWTAHIGKQNEPAESINHLYWQATWTLEHNILCVRSLPRLTHQHADKAGLIQRSWQKVLFVDVKFSSDGPLYSSTCASTGRKMVTHFWLPITFLLSSWLHLFHQPLLFFFLLLMEVLSNLSIVQL